MDFHQTEYQFFYEDHPYPKVKLHFKKSVFFFKNVLVCLGSNIKIDNGGTATKARTTLFQDKLARDASKFSIKMDCMTKDSSDLFEAVNPLSKNTKDGYTTLVDTKGNSYYIPESSASDLKLHVQIQNSQTVAAVCSSGIYATAWLEHNSTNAKYEDAVLVKIDSYTLTLLHVRTGKEILSCIWFFSRTRKHTWKNLECLPKLTQPRDHYKAMLSFSPQQNSLEMV